MQRPFDEVFPACAGMNRLLHRVGRHRRRVPRMRGDEPCASTNDRGRRCVPRMRGDEPALQPTEITDPVCSPHARG